MRCRNLGNHRTMKTDETRIPRRVRGERGFRARDEGSFSSSKVSRPFAQEREETWYYLAQTETLRQGLERDFRFPRPHRLMRVSVCSLTRQFGIGEATAHGLSHREDEAILIGEWVVFRGAIVEPEYLAPSHSGQGGTVLLQRRFL